MILAKLTCDNCSKPICWITNDDTSEYDTRKVYCDRCVAEFINSIKDSPADILLASEQQSTGKMK